MATKISWPKKLIIYTDGASRGNPGPASIGIYITDLKQKEVASITQTLGVQTNNFAEYSAVIEALRMAIKNKVTDLIIRSDSELLIRQLLGEYQIKSETLKPLYDECQRLARKIKKIKFEHVRRENNKEADRLANEGLDNE